MGSIVSRENEGSEESVDRRGGCVLSSGICSPTWRGDGLCINTEEGLLRLRTVAVELCVVVLSKR
jgi:hypothetical protein